MKPSDNGKDVANDEEKLLSDGLESPFRNFEPKLKITGVFIQRFFLRESYKNIANKYGISKSNARVTYSNAVNIILEELEALDQDGRKEIADNHYKKIYREKCSHMPKNMKWFLMANIFGLTPKEIAEIDGNTTNRNVSTAICRAKEHVKAGKFNLEDVLL